MRIKILKKVNTELVSLEDARVALINKYGEKDEKTKGMKVTEGNQEVFAKDYTTVLEQEIDLDIALIPFELLERSGIKVAATDLSNLEKFIEIPEELKEKVIVAKKEEVKVEPAK